MTCIIETVASIEFYLHRLNNNLRGYTKSMFIFATITLYWH